MQVPSTDYITLGHNPSPACHTSWALRSHSVGEHQITSVTQHCSTAICPPATPKPCPCINRGGVAVQEPWKNFQHCTAGGLIAAAQGAKPSRGHRISPGFTRKPTWLWFGTINQGRFYWKPSLGLCEKLANLNLAFNRQHFPSDFGFPDKYFAGLWFVIHFFLLLAFSAAGLCVMLRPSSNFRTFCFFPTSLKTASFHARLCHAHPCWEKLCRKLP